MTSHLTLPRTQHTFRRVSFVDPVQGSSCAIVEDIRFIPTVILSFEIA